MRIEQNQLSYAPVRQTQRPDQNQALPFDKVAQQANTEQSSSAQSVAAGVQSLSQSQPAPITGSIQQPLSQYLSLDEKNMLSALFPAAPSSLGVNAYQQSQQPGLHTAIRGQNLDLTS
jgi:hypothetical protein